MSSKPKKSTTNSPRGRPTKYTEGMPQAVYDCLAAGQSITQFAAQIGVARSTVYEWAREHPNFSDALTRAAEASQAFWEGELTRMMQDRNVNAPLVKLYFANRFGWRDKSEHDLRDMGPPGKIEVVPVGLPELYRQLNEITAKGQDND